MQDFSPSDLKAIMHSKRANLFYLEHCRVMQKDGRVLYLTEAKKENLYFNIPIANTTVILLGTGTSITQAAVRMLCQAGVLVGFCGGGGTPLYMGCEIEWMTPQNEYRPTEYLQGWMGFWFDDEKRLEIGKQFQQSRLDFLEKTWTNNRDLTHAGFTVQGSSSQERGLQESFKTYRNRIDSAKNPAELLLSEAQLAKQLYKFAANVTQQNDFKRQHKSTRTNNIGLANDFLNHGNYLTYGLAACTLWVLGIPHGFAVMHGKTRRGALVFDVADLIKDAIVLPWAFICAKENATEQEFRQQLLQAFTDNKVLDFLFKEVERASLVYSYKKEEK